MEQSNITFIGSAFTMTTHHATPSPFGCGGALSTDYDQQSSSDCSSPTRFWKSDRLNSCCGVTGLNFWCAPLLVKQPGN
jgi:hypothetical protein